METTQVLETKLPKLVTALPGPKAKIIVEQDHKLLSPSYTRDYPLVAQKGRGAMIEDVDGNVFLDFAAGIAVCSTGHCHPKVVAAIQAQAAELIHMSGTDFYYQGLVYLAQRLALIVPGAEDKRVYFGNSGAEAVEAALKLARYHTRRDKVIAFYGSFHGRTMGALSLTASRGDSAQGIRRTAGRRDSRTVSKQLPRIARNTSREFLQRDAWITSKTKCSKGSPIRRKWRRS